MIEAAIAAILAGFSYSLAADAGTNPWVPAGLAGFSFIAVLGLLWKIQKGYVVVQDHRIAVCSLETREAKLENEVCAWKMNRVVGHFRDIGISIPDNLLTDLPTYLLVQQERLSKERQGLDA